MVERFDPNKKPKTYIDLELARLGRKNVERYTETDEIVRPGGESGPIIEAIEDLEDSKTEQTSAAEEAVLQKEREQWEVMQAVNDNMCYSRELEKNEELHKENKEDIDETRRMLIKGGVAAVMLGIAGKLGFNFLKKSSKNIASRIELTLDEFSASMENGPEVVKQQAEENKEQEKVKEVKRLENERYPKVFEVLGLDKEGEIEINLEKIRKVIDLLKEQILTNKTLYNAYDGATYKMGAWEDKIRKHFMDLGVPEEYINIAIIESNMVCGAISESGAVGPYQFMPLTAKAHELEFFGGPDEKGRFLVDERRDPDFSGNETAVYLDERHRHLKDWNLSLSSFNGSYANTYVKEAIRDGNKDRSYGRFLSEFMTGRINKIKLRIEETGNFVYTIQRGDDLNNIAKKVKISVPELCRASGIEDSDKIFEGDKIVIDANRENRPEVLQFALSGLLQNLLYPCKYHAYTELYKEGVFKRKSAPYEIEKEEEVHGNLPTYIKHIASEKDTFFGLAHRTYGSLFKDKKRAVKLLMELNPDQAKNGISKGDTLKIPSNQTRPLTIRELARRELRKEYEAHSERDNQKDLKKQFQKDLDSLISKYLKLNPTYLNADVVIPDGSVIRFAKI